MESKLKVSWILISLLVISLLANHEAIAYKIKLEYGNKTAESVMIFKDISLQSKDPEKIILKSGTAQYQEVIKKLRQFNARDIIGSKCMPDTYYTFYNPKGDEILTTFTLP